MTPEEIRDRIAQIDMRREDLLHRYSRWGQRTNLPINSVDSRSRVNQFDRAFDELRDERARLSALLPDEDDFYDDEAGWES